MNETFTWNHHIGADLKSDNSFLAVNSTLQKNPRLNERYYGPNNANGFIGLAPYRSRSNTTNFINTLKK